jgi:hypothetical protein
VSILARWSSIASLAGSTRVDIVSHFMNSSRLWEETQKRFKKLVKYRASIQIMKGGVT